MFQIRIHGRGGQGVVTAAELLSIAAFIEGKHAQAFPTFGSERMGAPVMAFCRIADHSIRLREPVMEPDSVIVQDATLVQHVAVFDGMKPSGYALINSEHSVEEFRSNRFNDKLLRSHCYTIPATRLAIEHVGRPVPNVPLLGAFVAITELLTISSVMEAVKHKFSGSIAEANIAAARAGYEHALLIQELAHAETD
jgi:pyruvate ferredoxin oxidoreductase gamma subunit